MGASSASRGHFYNLYDTGDPPPSSSPATVHRGQREPPSPVSALPRQRCGERGSTGRCSIPTPSAVIEDAFVLVGEAASALGAGRFPRRSHARDQPLTRVPPGSGRSALSLSPTSLLLVGPPPSARRPRRQPSWNCAHADCGARDGEHVHPPAWAEATRAASPSHERGGLDA